MKCATMTLKLLNSKEGCQIVIVMENRVVHLEMPTEDVHLWL